MSGNLEDHVRYKFWQYGYPSSPIRMADGYWLYEGKKYYSPAYISGGVRSPARVVAELEEAIRLEKAEYVEPETIEDIEAVTGYLDEIDYTQPDAPLKPKIEDNSSEVEETKFNTYILALILGGILIVWFLSRPRR